LSAELEMISLSRCSRFFHHCCQTRQLHITHSHHSLRIQSECLPQHAKLLLLSSLRAVSVCFPVCRLHICCKSDMVAVAVDVFRVTLAAANVRSHAAGQTYSLFVCAGAVAGARAYLSGPGGWSQRPVWVVFRAGRLRVRVVEVVLSGGGSTTLELAGPGTRQLCLSRKRRWRR